MYVTKKNMQEKEFSRSRRGHIGFDPDMKRQKQELLVRQKMRHESTQSQQSTIHRRSLQPAQRRGTAPAQRPSSSVDYDPSVEIPSISRRSVPYGTTGDSSAQLFFQNIFHGKTI